MPIIQNDVQLELPRKSRKLKNEKPFFTYFKKKKLLYIMLIPCIIYFIIYKYIPLFGIIIAFQDYNPMTGFLGSSFVGLKHFKLLLSDPVFWQAFNNTLVISTLKLVFGFPAPIILALLLNELRGVFYKRVVQSVTYIPHFFSWVVMGGIFIQFFYRSGFINMVLIQPLFGTKIDFFADPQYFRILLVVTDILKNVGWSAIIYTAALTAVDMELYQAALIDGAGRFKQIIHITIPSIMHIIVIMLIFAIGGILNAGFDQIFVMYNPLVYNVSDIIDTYVYRIGLEQSQFSYSTAVGLFKSVVCIILVLVTNKIAHKMDQEGIW